MISWMVHYLILDQIKVPYLNCSNEPPDNPEHFISGSKRHLLEKVVPHKRFLGIFFISLCYYKNSYFKMVIF